MIVKVCGMREPANIRAVEECGVDWIGFIFYPRSPRCLTAKPAYLPQKARRIGVFVDAPREEILLRASEYGLHGVQLHGNEYTRPLPRDAIGRLQGHQGSSGTGHRPLYRLRRGVRLLSLRLANFTARRLWCCFRRAQLDRYRLSTPFLLSGGLGPENLAALLRWNHPQWAGIDLNSRFERQPAIKDVEKLQAYIARFRAHNF